MTFSLDSLQFDMAIFYKYNVPVTWDLSFLFDGPMLSLSGTVMLKQRIKEKFYSILFTLILIRGTAHQRVYFKLCWNSSLTGSYSLSGQNEKSQ